MTPAEVVRSVVQSAIGSTVEERIRPDRRYQEDELPAATYSVSGAEPIETLDGVQAVQYTGSVSLWASTRQEADSLAASVAEEDGVDVADAGQTWTWFWTGYVGSAELVAEESDRPEYRADVSFILVKT